MPDGTGHRVLAEQRALRPAQDLDPVEIREVVEGETRTRPVDAVDEGAHGGFEPGVVARGAHAADAQRAAVGRAVGVVDDDGRRHLHEPVDVLGPTRRQVFAGDGGHGDGDVLDRLLALGRGHYDRLDTGRRLGRLGCGSRQRKSDRGDGYEENRGNGTLHRNSSIVAS